MRVEINEAAAPAIMASEKSCLFIVCISVQGSDVWSLGALGHSCQSVVQRRSPAGSGVQLRITSHEH